MNSRLISFAVNRPRAVTWAMVFTTLLLALLAGLPSLWPRTFGFLSPLRVDTDPENMLPAEEAVRVFHNRMKEEMSLSDMVVVGVVNETDPDGVFNPESLARIYELTEFAKTLTWADPDRPGERSGVIDVDVIAPSTVENILQDGPGTVRFEWLMGRPPSTRAGAQEVRENARRLPFLRDTLLSGNGKAVALYLPLTAKDQSYRVAEALKEKIAGFSGNDRYFITGLPVAQDTFGVEMFKQMAVAAPMAMAIIFLLMLIFFRKLVLIVSPLIVALVSVICTMSLLVITGRTVHIMSSMIPIFIMPIAVLDAVHILSEFFDRFRETGDRKQTLHAVMRTLFTPMLYTSLTTSVGFASLALTPIPPVQVFGIYIAFGVATAWIWTVLFIPAFIMLIPARSLANFGALHDRREDREISRAVRERRHTISSNLTMTWLLGGAGRLTYRHARTVLAVVAVLVAVSIWGISRITINDNPTKWFTSSHPIRVADRVLNHHFAGTYTAYLALKAPETGPAVGEYADGLEARLEAKAREAEAEYPGASKVFSALEAHLKASAGTAASPDRLLQGLVRFAESAMDKAPSADLDAWDEALLALDAERQRGEVFKQPRVLRYIAGLQNHLLSTGVVGKSNSLADIVKTVYRELVSGRDSDLRIPDSAGAVGQALITYQNSHRPQDLWHFVTPDYRTTVLWIQLKSGDNRDMEKVLDSVDGYLRDNPPPEGLEAQWFGLTYINVVWQKKMVSGMLQAFLGSFLIVFLMMTVLYRSALWGVLSMIPLVVTIGMIYGFIGLVGKDYDMPVAVLSSLSLGLAVDYAIHFLSRSRELYERCGTWERTVAAVFGEPARAIARNVIVVGVGFLPLLLAPLVPYQTVGLFIAAILVTAGVATLLILPALITVLNRLVFPRTRAAGITCNCATCAVSAAAVVLVAVINLKRFLDVGVTALTWWSLGAIVAAAALCSYLSRRRSCRSVPADPGSGESTINR
ncbi:MAG TPA: MMPL family transporter [bacterium]|nr:MMPL family transporter [bacterium]